MKALIYRTIVKGIFDKEFPVTTGLTWVDIPAQATVDVGNYYKDGEFSKTDPEIKPPIVVEDPSISVLKAMGQFVLGEITKEDFKIIYDSYREL